MEPSLLQTEKWEKLQRELGENCFFETGEGWQFLAILKPAAVGEYLYLPYGPYVTDEKAAKECFRRILALAREKKCVFVRVEPQQKEATKGILADLKARKVKDLNPAETLKIDLTQTEEAIMANYSASNRNYARNLGKKGVKVRATKAPEDLKYLVKFQREVAKRKGFATFDEKYLEKELGQDFANLYLAYYDAGSDTMESEKEKPADQEVIAAAMFFDGQAARHYMQAAADDRFRHLQATLLIVHEAMMDAKKAGLKGFDLWGIAPEGSGPEHPWYGFTKFKRAFGGEEVDYAGTYDIVLDRAKYGVYEMLRKANRVARKVRRG